MKQYKESDRRLINILINIGLVVILIAVIIFVSLLMMSNMIETMKPFDINCSEVNGTILTKECYCNNFNQLISFNWSNFDCGCPEIAGTYCILSNGTSIKLITVGLS